MNFAVLVPGQGLDLSAPATAWYGASVATRRLLDVAAERVQQPLAHLLHGAGRALRQTECYQPVLTALCGGILHEVEQRVGAASVALGHSLGELVACVAVGVLTIDDAVAAAVLRGQLMAREAALHPGGMLALRATFEETQDAVARASTSGPICVAALNARDQHVVSGAHAALRAIPAGLNPVMIGTEGAWHSPAMQAGVDELRVALEMCCNPATRAQWISNRTGDVVVAAGHVPALLSAQLTHPVQWVRSLETLVSLGVDVVVTLGPAKAQRALSRRTLRDAIRFISVEVPEDLTLLHDVHVA